MPIEIKELVIRAVALRDGEIDASDAPPADRLGPRDTRAVDQAAIVAAAVRETLRILRGTRER